MAENKALLIVNPNSGDGEAKRWIYDITSTLLRRYDFVTVYYSKCMGDTVRVVREEAASYEAVICVGGDGTLNETICGMVEGGTKPALGYIPTGTVNDFATSHRIPKGIKGALEKLETAMPEEYDVGELGGRPFSYVAAFGAFTEVAYLTPQGVKASFGRTAYVAEAAKRLFSLAPIEATVTCGGEEISGRFIYGMVTNSKTVGGIRFFEDSSSENLRDGKLEFTLVRYPDTAAELQGALTGLLTPRVKNENVIKLSASEAHFRFHGSAPWTVDGEYGGDYPEVTVRTLARRIRVLE